MALAALLGVVLLAVPAALSADRRGVEEAPSLGPAPTGLPQTWIAGLHLSGHIFHPGDKITATATVNADRCFVPEPPCVRGAEWSLGGGAGKILAGCKSKVPLGKPTLHCTFRAAPAEGWQIAGANFPNPTGTSAVSQDFYVVIGKDKRVLDGTVTNRKSGTPVANVKISIRGAKTYLAATNASGYYHAVLPKGRYRVVPLGGERNVFLPALASVRLGPRATADFKLKEKPVEIEWAMPERTPEWKAGSTVYMTDPGQINPSSWPVEFVLKTATGTVCAEGTQYAWQVDGKQAQFSPTDRPCHFTSSFPAQGKYLVTLTVRQPDGEELDGKATVEPRDFLVVGLGDSVGSGEGNPDAKGPTWEDANCHRSHYSFEAVAARKLEEKDPHTSVTLIHLACSGAGIENGIVGRYIGFESQPLDPQLTQLRNLIGPRKVDALVVSIAANDIGFGNIVGFCSNVQGGGDRTVPPNDPERDSPEDIDDDCMNKVPPVPAPDAPPLLNPVNPFDDKKLTLGQITQARLARLNCSPPTKQTINHATACTEGGLFGRLAAGFKELGIPATRTYITQYFDPTRDANGKICHVILGTAPIVLTKGGVIGFREATWASSEVVGHGLNRVVPQAAGRYGWHMVGGIQDGFRPHGFCSGGARWVVTLLDAIGLGNTDGTLHPNQPGHEFSGERVFSELERALYKGGKPRPPDK